jgi:hypothetical protein
VSLTDRGYRAKRALNQNLAWSTIEHAIDPTVTTSTWTRFLSGHLMPEGTWFDYFATSDHPLHQEIRLNLTQIRIDIWRKVIPTLKKPDHPLFKRIAELPGDAYAEVRAEAFHHKLIIWEPTNVG